jgi:uncharacterized DUF497 family protein
MVFEWDERKAEINARKHHVRFDEGATIFNDPLIATMSDPDHSSNEERYISIGYATTGILLVVVHTWRQERVRIISCRRATRRERSIYERGT